MSTKKAFFVVSFILVSCGGAASLSAQTPPSEAQIKRDLMNPGVIEIIIRGKGSFEKFVENRAVVNEYYRSVTVRRRSDRPGITVDVLGDVVYRLIGGRWVYRKMRLAGNTYGGLANPTIAELNKLVELLEPRDIDNMYTTFVGEIESIKLWSFPNWEWHSPNSVSFNIVVVHSYIHSGGSYTRTEMGGQPEQIFSPFVAVDRVERIQRWRIYRDGEKEPWKSMTFTKAGRIGDYIKDGNGNSIEMIKLLGRKKVMDNQVDGLPRPTRVPQFTE